jgi:hypothetical protein
MSRYILSAISILYLLATLVFHSFWNGFYQSLGVRLDLTPEQMRVLPPAMNLLAVGFSVPSVLLLLGKEPTAKSRGGFCYAASILSAITAVLLMAGVVRWIVMDPHSISTGVIEFIHTNKDNDDNPEGIREGVFRDAKLEVSFRLPEKWEIFSANAIRRAHDSGARSMLGRNPTASELRQPPGIVQFLAIKKHPESYQAYNPSIAFVSYDKGAMKAQGCSSLRDLVHQWSSVGPPYKVISGPSIADVGVFDGYRIQLRGDFGGVLVQQHIYAFETSGHYVSATVSVQDAKDRAVLENVIKSITKDQ